MTPIISYLKDGSLPKDRSASRRLKVQASRFILICNFLYKRGFSHPYLQCVVPNKADYVMREIHEGVCRNHSGAWSLIHKLIWAEYYWPTMQKDTKSYVKTCDKFLVIEIDCFTKWVEVEPLATITEKNIRGFVWKNVVCCSGSLGS